MGGGAKAPERENVPEPPAMRRGAFSPNMGRCGGGFVLGFDDGAGHEQRPTRGTSN